MPGGAAAVPVRTREFATKFDLDQGHLQVRQMAQNASQTIAMALRNLHQTSIQLRQTVAALNEEQTKLWESMQDVASLASVNDAAAAFEGLVKQFEA